MIELLLAGEALLAQGELERAEHIFRQVADSDPRNAIAVVGLARVAQLRGDVTSALEIARRALAIDPADVAARRLVAGLIAAGALLTRDQPDSNEDRPAPPSSTEQPSRFRRLLAFFRRRPT